MYCALLCLFEYWHFGSLFRSFDLFGFDLLVGLVSCYCYLFAVGCPG